MLANLPVPHRAGTEATANRIIPVSPGNISFVARLVAIQFADAAFSMSPACYMPAILILITLCRPRTASDGFLHVVSNSLPVKVTLLDAV